MLKRYFIIGIVLCFTSCGSYNAMNQFYNAHKNDPQVTAIQVPKFMFVVLKGLSPNMNSLLNNVNDMRYIQLQPKTETENASINNEINGMLTKDFVDIYRKNENQKRTLVSVREKNAVVKEIIVYKNNGLQNSILYLNGNFDPNTVRKYAENNEFDNLTQSLSNQYQWNTTSPKLY